MRVLISADMEGITGLVSWRQCGAPRGEHYDFAFARRMMTHDVNAAIRGARAAGATEIVVRDAHGTSKNLLIDELEPGIELISGNGVTPDGMVTGITHETAAVFLIGYHAMAGTPHGVMEHTLTGSVHRYWINGRESGEIAMATATAGHYGVPVVLVTSDDAGCAEAAQLIPGLETVSVKRGVGRYAAQLKSPSVTGPAIESAARNALARRAEIAPWTPRSPVHLRLEHNRTEETDAASLLLGWDRTDGHTVEMTCPDWPTAHQMTWRAMMNATRLGPGLHD